MNKEKITQYSGWFSEYLTNFDEYKSRKRSYQFLSSDIKSKDSMEERLEQIESEIVMKSKICSTIESKFNALKNDPDIEEFKSRLIQTIGNYREWANGNIRPDLCFPLDHRAFGYFESFFGLLCGELVYRMKSGDFNPCDYGYRLSMFHINSIGSEKWVNINLINRFLNQEMRNLSCLDLNFIGVYDYLVKIHSRWESID